MTGHGVPPRWSVCVRRDLASRLLHPATNARFPGIDPRLACLPTSFARESPDIRFETLGHPGIPKLRLTTPSVLSTNLDEPALALLAPVELGVTRVIHFISSESTSTHE